MCTQKETKIDGFASRQGKKQFEYITYYVPAILPIVLLVSATTFNITCKDNIPLYQQASHNKRQYSLVLVRFKYHDASIERGSGEDPERYGKSHRVNEAGEYAHPRRK